MGRRLRPDPRQLNLLDALIAERLAAEAAAAEEVKKAAEHPHPPRPDRKAIVAKAKATVEKARAAKVAAWPAIKRPISCRGNICDERCTTGAFCLVRPDRPTYYFPGTKPVKERGDRVGMVGNGVHRSQRGTVV